jgi:hypothetical protein
MVFFFIVLTNLCFQAQAAEIPTPDDDNIPPPKKEQKVRSNFFMEIMSPGSNSPGYVPAEDGSPLIPSNIFAILWIDYPIAEDTRIGYWQRGNANLAGSQTFRVRNPRFELRKLNVWKKQGLSSTYDFYIQPGIAPEGGSIASGGSGRSLEIGIRTSHAYTFPESHWSIGMTTETTKAFSFRGPTSANVYGWAMPWINHHWSTHFSHEHYFTLSLQQLSQDPWHRIVYDYPMPLATQNGVSYHYSESVSITFLVNNYLNTAPTLKNTWFSFWLSAKIL